MSKGWYVKVETNVVFRADTNIGVVASCEREAMQEAAAIVRKEIRNSALDLGNIPWDFKIGALECQRSGDVYVEESYVEPVHAEVDPDFNPDPDPDRAEQLMEAAQCLNEAYHDLPNDHPLQLYRDTHGICVVRSYINDLAAYATDLHQLMVDEQGYDNCFDWDFIPTFLERCVEDDFTVRSKDLHVLSMYWGLR